MLKATTFPKKWDLDLLNQIIETQNKCLNQATKLKSSTQDSSLNQVEVQRLIKLQTMSSEMFSKGRKTGMVGLVNDVYNSDLKSFLKFNLALECIQASKGLDIEDLIKDEGRRVKIVFS